jgi:hypothetical protein
MAPQGKAFAIAGKAFAITKQHQEGTTELTSGQNSWHSECQSLSIKM